MHNIDKRKRIFSGNGTQQRMRNFSKAFLAIVASTIMVSAFALPNLLQHQQAGAYSITTCKFDVSSSETISYKFDSSVTVNKYKDLIRNAAAKLNDAGLKFKLVENSAATTKVITVYQVNIPGGFAGYGNIGTCTAPTNIATYGTVQLNHPVLSPLSRDSMISISAHEFAHALGLNHFGSQTLMVSEPATPARKALTLDEYMGLKAKYGLKTPNYSSLCSPTFAGGTVTYTGGSCTTSTPGYPVTMKVTTAGTNNNAGIFSKSTSSIMPSWNCLDTAGHCGSDDKDGTIVISAKVKATTLNKFSMGVYTNNVISDATNRVATIEMNSNGFYLVGKNFSTGGTLTKTISTTAPTLNQNYWLMVILDKTGSVRAYVYKVDGSGVPPATSPEPTMIGGLGADTTATISSTAPWTTTGVYYGMGVWMPSGAGSLPNYTVSEYHNLLRTYQ